MKRSKSWMTSPAAVLALGVTALVVAQAATTYKIPMQSGVTIELQEGSIDASGGRYVIIQFGQKLTREAIERLHLAGVNPLSVLYRNAWVCAVDPSALRGSAPQTLGVLAAAPWRAEYKSSAPLRRGEASRWAFTDQGKLKLLVTFFADVKRGEMETVLARYDPFYTTYEAPNVWALQIAPGRMEDLLKEPLVYSVEAGPRPMEPLNDRSRALIRVDPVQKIVLPSTSGPPTYLGLSGQGVNIAVSEAVYTDHPDFWNHDASGSQTTSRFLNTGFASVHGTHVSGIIGGNGWNSNRNGNQGSPFQWRGMAPEATLISGVGYGTFAVQASNHSYVMEYGTYGYSSNRVDREVNGRLGLAYQRPHIWAAANQGINAQYNDEEGHYSIYAPAKNAICAGAVSANDASLAPYSSLGPTFDGRIKPDVVAAGSNIVSTFADDGAYLVSSGTSMAAPAVTGTVALMLQQFVRRGMWVRQNWESVDLNDNPPLPSTVKAILIQTAHDLVHERSDPRDPANPDTGQPILYYRGPDFATGYGLVDAEAAVKLIDDAAGARLIRESEFSEDRLHVYELTAVPPNELKVTLVWDDVEGSVTLDQRVPRLVNDLDLVLVDPSGNRHYPWTLDPLPVAACGGAGPGCGDPDPIRPEDVRPAKRAPDHRNNVEQVQPDTPQPPGAWHALVAGRDIQDISDGPQTYSLVSSAPLGLQADVLLCDADDNQSIDLRDINAIVAARNTPATGLSDARDGDVDGQITVLDARLCVLRCTKPYCAQ